MDQQSARELAFFGAEFLDIIEPDWPLRVPPWVDIRFNEICALGCLYGTFSRGMEKLGLERPDLFGFYVFGNQKDPAVIAAYARLTAAWREERMRRLSLFEPEEVIEAAVALR